MANQPDEGQKELNPQELMEAVGFNSENPSAHNDNAENASASSGPLSVEIGGEVFNNPDEFRVRYKELISNKERAEEAQTMRSQYADIFKEKMKILESRIREAQKAIRKSFKFKRNTKNQRSKMGVLDILQSFLDEGILIYQNDRFSTPKDFTLASGLAIAANEQIVLINKINDIRHRKINGFAHFDKNANFVYQLRIKEDDITGRPTYEVYNLITIHGKPSIEEKMYSEYEVPNLIQLDIAKFKIRREERKKYQEKMAKKDKKNKPDQPKKKAEEASEKQPEKKKPKNTINEEIKAMSEAIKANAKELKIINQALGAMLHHQDHVAGVKVTPEQLETMIRKSTGQIDEDGEDIRDTIKEEDKGIVFIDTPKHLADLIKMEMSLDSLKSFARDLHKELEVIKALQVPEDADRKTDVTNLPKQESDEEKAAESKAA